jgi:hypothetical protein
MLALIEIALGIAWILLVVIAYAVFVLYRHFGQLYVTSAVGRAEQGPDVGSAFLSISRSDVRGRNVTLPSGQGTVVLFADVDCDLCSELREGYANVFGPDPNSTDLVVFCTGSEKDVEAWASRIPEYVRVIWDEKKSAANRYKVSALPFAVAVGRNGRVNARSVINGEEGLRWAADEAAITAIILSEKDTHPDEREVSRA